MFERYDDAADALREMRHGRIGSCSIRTSVALPRGSRRSPRPYRRDGGYDARRGGGYGDRGGYNSRRRSRSPKSRS